MIEAQPTLSPWEKRRLLKQTLWLWALAMLLLRAIFELQRWIPFLRQNGAVFTAMVLLYLPMLWLWRRGERANYFEDSPRKFLNSLLLFALVSLVIFPPLQVLNHFFQDWAWNHHYRPGQLRDLGSTIFFQLLLVALPEEFFYRGFVQSRFNKIWEKRWRLFGAELGYGWLATAGIFALSHSLVRLQWWHFSIFFPALVFGWLRERTGKITAGIFFHALCNLYSFWVAVHYR